MSKVKTVAGNAEYDPTLPKVAIELSNKKYFLAFTFRALALAQAELSKVGVEVNLLQALDLSTMDALKLVPLLYAALISHQPKITFDEVMGLVTFRNMGLIFEGIAQAYGASLADPTDDDVKADPDQPVV
jgi:hypothetical protein